MTVSEVIELLDIPYTTFQDWNKVGHKKYQLTLLLLGLDKESASQIISKQKESLKSTPKYKDTTRWVVLQKKWFDSDLFWTTADNTKLEIKNIIVIYMDRATQRNTDKLCELFGYQRVYNTVEKYITNPKNKKEAFRQIEYFQYKRFRIPFLYTQEELQGDYLKYPTQRLIDYYCNLKGCDTILEEVKNRDMSQHKKLTIEKMIEYYKKELDDTTVTKSA
ncbi:hypothetical protein [Arcobacter sp. FWKO B]|uniref:hypothetical protein n=1 Tax=Arcobacter sp. FWKO B TaxID=2593672 RepID=UPI0018A4A679|nr:hypothetical protein [Arcobacter sp. FWKO B]QOG12799.1 hypothetical protein FWKOB_08875 [Arcobacter sp. FWKO B]